MTGCRSTPGCFGGLSFERTHNGRMAVNQRDARVMMVEFGDTPRAWTVLAYGQINRKDSPDFDDQAPPFTEEPHEPVAWTDAEIDAPAVQASRPLEETDVP
ncbi:MAG: penicillin acylase family protein [Gemmatimonadota bacterium]